MKIRNYLMYWANRLMDPNFKNEYYLANLNKFWESTYEELCMSGAVSAVMAVFFFPWGINFSEHHPLYNAGWAFAVGQFFLSCGITFTALTIFVRSFPGEDKVGRSVWVMVGMFLSSLMLQHAFTGLLYRTIPLPMVASLVPLVFFLSSVITIAHLPVAVLDKANQWRDKFVSGVTFVFVEPLSGSFRLTLMLEKIFGKPPVKPHSVVKDLAVPNPKDYKIWGVKSKEEKELQKILDE